MLLTAALLGQVAGYSAAAQPGGGPWSAQRGEGIEPGLPGPPTAELSLIDMGRLRPVAAPPAPTLTLHLAPNPTTSSALVQLQIEPALAATLSVRDVLGRSVLPPRALPGNAPAFSLDLGDQPAGVYFVTVEAGGYHHVQRLLKQ